MFDSKPFTSHAYMFSNTPSSIYSLFLLNLDIGSKKEMEID